MTQIEVKQVLSNDQAVEITKGALLAEPFTLRTTVDRIYLEHRVLPRALVIAGFWNSCIPVIEEVPTHYWAELERLHDLDATPAAIKVLKQVREELVEKVERGEITYPERDFDEELEVTIKTK